MPWRPPGETSRLPAKAGLPREQLVVAPIICVKPEQEDLFISSSLLHSGLWEEEIVANVLRAVLWGTDPQEVVFLGRLRWPPPPLPPQTWALTWACSP